MSSLRGSRCTCCGTIVVEHVRQDILGVLQALGHLLVVAVESVAQRHDRPLTSLVHVGDEAVFRVEQDFCVVLEVDLNNLVA